MNFIAFGMKHYAKDALMMDSASIIPQKIKIMVIMAISQIFRACVETKKQK